MISYGAVHCGCEAVGTALASDICRAVSANRPLFAAGIRTSYIYIYIHAAAAYFLSDGGDVKTRFPGAVFPRGAKRKALGEIGDVIADTHRRGNGTRRTHPRI